MEFAGRMGRLHVLCVIFRTRFELCNVWHTREFLVGRSGVGVDVSSDRLDLCALGQSMGKTNRCQTLFPSKRLNAVYFFSGARRTPTGNLATSRHSEL